MSGSLWPLVLLARPIPQGQCLADARGDRTLVDRLAKHDVADGEAAVPEGDALVARLSAGPVAGGECALVRLPSLFSGAQPSSVGFGEQEPFPPLPE